MNPVVPGPSEAGGQRRTIRYIGLALGISLFAGLYVVRPSWRHFSNLRVSSGAGERDGDDLADADVAAFELRCGRKHPQVGCPWNSLEPEVAAGGFSAAALARCNPYVRRCDCLTDWLGLATSSTSSSSGDSGDSSGGDSGPCSAAAMESSGLPTVRLAVHGWMAEEASYPTTLACRRSRCEARGGWTSGSGSNQAAWAGVDVNLLAMTYSHEWKAPSGMHRLPLAIASYESRVNYPFHNTTRYMALPDIGLSYAPRHLGAIPVQLSYNDYSPASFGDPGHAPWSERSNSLLFIYGKCYPHRMAIMRALAAHFTIDSLGGCAPNKKPADVAPECADIPAAARSRLNVCVMRRYKFVLTIENSAESWYSTEKLWQPLRAGAVPIYWGAPNVRDYLPHPAAVVSVTDYPDIDSLAAYVTAAQADERLWASHTAWKRGGPSATGSSSGSGWRHSSWPAAFRSITQRPLHSMLCDACDAVVQHRGLMWIPAPALAPDASVYMRACVTRSLQQLVTVRPAPPTTGGLRAYYYAHTLTQRGITQLLDANSVPVALGWTVGAATAGLTAVPPSAPDGSKEPAAAVGSEGQLPDFDYHCWTTKDVGSALEAPAATPDTVLRLLPFIAALRDMVREGAPHALFILPPAPTTTTSDSSSGSSGSSSRGLAPTPLEAAAGGVPVLDVDGVAGSLAVRATRAVASAAAGAAGGLVPSDWHVLLLPNPNPSTPTCGDSTSNHSCGTAASVSTPSRLLPTGAFLVSATGAVSLLQQLLPLTDAGVSCDGLRFLQQQLPSES